MAYTDNDRKYYFVDSIRKTTTAFMSLFTNIRIAKYNENKTIVNYREVPITFGSKQKFTAWVKKMGNSSDKYNYSLPRIGIIVTGFSPNWSKVCGPEILPIFKSKRITDIKYDNIYRPVVYDLNFTVSILSQHLSEVNQILEQIIPNFNPYKTVTIREFDMFPEFTRDIKILLKDTVPQFQDEIPENEIRRITWDLNFTCECYVYRPILYSNIIKDVNVNLNYKASMDSLSAHHVSSYEFTVSGNSIDDYDVTKDLWTKV